MNGRPVREDLVTAFYSQQTLSRTLPSDFRPLPRSILLQKVMKRMRRSRQIEQELTIIAKMSQTRLQIRDTEGLLACMIASIF